MIETPVPEGTPVPTVTYAQLGLAQTGTGKTASFTLPMIQRLSQGRAKARMPHPLVITPTCAQRASGLCCRPGAQKPEESVMNKHLYTLLLITTCVCGFTLKAQAETPTAPSCVADACRPHSDATMAAQTRLQQARAAVTARQATVDQLQAARTPLAKAVDDQTQACTAWRATKPRNPTKAIDDRGTDCENRRIQAGLALAAADARLNAAIADRDAAQVEARIAAQGLSSAEVALTACKKVCRLTP